VSGGGFESVRGRFATAEKEGEAVVFSGAGFNPKVALVAVVADGSVGSVVRKEAALLSIDVL